MQDTQLYHQLLGIQSPWFAASVELDIHAEAVRVYLDFESREASWCCPDCGKPAPLYDRRESRTWRHLDSCQFQTYLVAALPRVTCPLHGVLTASVFWAEPNSRYTALFERFAIDVLLATQVQARAARLLRCSPEQMAYLMEKAVARGLMRRDRTVEVSHLGLDEKAYHQGHQYATILTDLEAGRVIDLVESRTQEAATLLLETALSEEQKEAVRSVSMDLWQAFANAQAVALPHADKVHDRFHVAGYLNEAVDATRKEEHRRLLRQEDATLASTKYLWLRSEGTLTDKQKQSLAMLSSLELETAKVWAFKECFRQFFDCRTEFGAATFFEQWYAAAQAVGSKALCKTADLLQKHLDGLLAYVRHRVTNAVAENLNGQIQRVKSNARGFRAFANFRVAVLFFLGKLDLYPQTSR